MKRRLLLILLVGATCDCQTKTTPQSAAFAESAFTAYDSIRSLSLNVHASETGFQLRQVDAEKNLAAAERKVITDEDKRQFEILTSWSRLIDRHRDLMNTGQQESSPLVSDVWGAEFKCSVEAGVIFKPSAKTSDPKALRDLEGKWADKTCIEAAKGAITDSYQNQK